MFRQLQETMHSDANPLLSFSNGMLHSLIKPHLINNTTCDYVYESIPKYFECNTLQNYLQYISTWI